MGDGRLGRYRLDELLGSGGSGQVWRAHDTMTDRTVALKVLAPALAADASYRKRFEREARAAARLRGPHVVPLHHFGEVEGRLFIETAFIDGVDLESLLEWEGARTPEAAVELIAQIATALDEAHAAKVIHRDVKPGNIMVGLDDVAYLIDFGTALQDGQSAMTLSGMVIGTPAYMAPERFTGEATPRSDIYSLACVLYECLTGERPFRGRNPARLMNAHVNSERPHACAVNAKVSRGLDMVIRRGMAKNPDERYCSAGEFAAAAKAALRVPDPDPPTLALPPVSAVTAAASAATTAPLPRLPKPVAAPTAAAGDPTEPIDALERPAASGKHSAAIDSGSKHAHPAKSSGAATILADPADPTDARKPTGAAGVAVARNDRAEPSSKDRKRVVAALITILVIATIIAIAWLSSRDDAPHQQPNPVISAPVTTTPESPAQQPVPASPLAPATTTLPRSTTTSEPPATTTEPTAPPTTIVPVPQLPIPTQLPQASNPNHKPDKPDKPGHDDKPNKPK